MVLVLLINTIISIAIKLHYQLCLHHYNVELLLALRKFHTIPKDMVPNKFKASTITIIVAADIIVFSSIMHGSVPDGLSRAWHRTPKR